MHKRLGEPVHTGDMLVEVLCDDRNKVELARELLVESMSIDDEKPQRFALWQEFDPEA
jgi:thymidine phosphorylase